MRKLLPRAALAVMLAAGVTMADDSGTDRHAATRDRLEAIDKEFIQGVWVFDGAEVDGRAEDENGRWHIIYNGTKWTYQDGIETSTKNPGYRATYVLDSARRPPLMMLAPAGDRSKMEFVLYDVRENTLRFCLWLGKLDVVPPAFNSEDGRIILILKRDKPADKPDH